MNGQKSRNKKLANGQKSRNKKLATQLIKLRIFFDPRNYVPSWPWSKDGNNEKKNNAN